jgi:hypothetical protein
LTSLLGLWFLGLGVALRRRKCLAWLSKALALLVAWVSPLFGLLTALMRIRRSALNHKHDAADWAHGEFTWRLLRYVNVDMEPQKRGLANTTASAFPRGAQLFLESSDFVLGGEATRASCFGVLCGCRACSSVCRI